MKTLRWSIVILVLALAPLLLTPSGSRMLTEMLYLSLFALSFNFLYHYLGLLSFGHNLAFGVSAYVVAIYFNANPQGSILAAFALAVVAASVVTTISGLLLVKLKGGYFALMTMACCQLAYFVASKWTSVTKGDDGLLISVPQLHLWGLDSEALTQSVLLCWLALAVVLLGVALTYWFLQTPLGRAAILLRENEFRAQFLGYHVHQVKLAAFNVAGLTAGMAGFLFALFQGLVSPVVLAFGLSGDVIMMTLIGGSGSLLGPAMGAAIYTGIEDVLPGITAHPRFFMAALFVAVVLFLPEGISGLLSRLRGLRLPGLRRVRSEA